MASVFARFFGRTVSDAAGFAAGVAVGPVLSPVVEEIRLRAWDEHPVRRLEPGDAAEIVAEDVEARDWGAHEASGHGVDGERFDALTNAVRNAPGLSELFELWRRDLITDAQFTHGLRKSRLELRWDGPLEGLKDTLLSSEELAMLQQQGFVEETRANSEGRLQGVTSERQQLRYEASGLPPGAAEAQSLLNRGLIDDATFAQIIREGHTKTKYTDLLRSAAVYVLSPINYVEGRLRGWLTDSEMYAGTALHGVTKADTDLLFKIHGRPISFRQTFIGRRRGGTLDGPITEIDPAFLASLRRSNIQPSFYNLAWAQRFTYPSAFVLRNLTQTGEITRADAEQVLLYEGWEPGFAEKVAAAWAGGGSTGADAHVGKAQTQLWTRTHSSYLAGEISEDDARTALAAAGVAAAAVDQVLAVWNHERDLERKQLTPTQVKKAYTHGVTNPATGTAWTRDDALAALIGRGYSPADANTFLDL